ncbi:transporter YfdV [Escherichia coli]|uniref:Transporter YfdV n=1 Tax=Escherichia coli TaxID=562 RepID=A0A376KPR0_ECOLX|nr:transporter YfdV [Escherichia coli]
MTLAAHKFEFSAEIAYNTFLKLILMPLALLLVGMACHLNSEHLQMMVLAGALPPAFSGIIIASRFNVYTRTGTASLAVSVLGFVRHGSPCGFMSVRLVFIINHVIDFT